MFKSCHYCRHRKKKCVLPQPPASDSRCFACQHLDIRCEIGLRTPSLKRRLKSQEVSSRVYTQSAPNSSPLPLRSTETPRETVHVNNGDCQLPRFRADAGSGEAAKIIMTEDRFDGAYRDLDQMSLAAKYEMIVSREFPFIPQDFLLAMGEEDIPELLRYCLDLAVQLSLQNAPTGLSQSQLQRLSTLVKLQDLDLMQAAGLMLLLPRANLDQSLMEKASERIAGAQDMLPITGEKQADGPTHRLLYPFLPSKNSTTSHCPLYLAPPQRTPGSVLLATHSTRLLLLCLLQCCLTTAQASIRTRLPRIT